MMLTQADIDRWAEIIARTYGRACRPQLLSGDVASLARELNTPMADLLMSGASSSEWASGGVDEALGRWERMKRRRLGPRLRAVDYGDDTVTFG